MIILIDAEKNSWVDNIQHLYIIENPNKMGTGGTYLNTLKVIYDKPIAHIILMVKN